MRLKSRKPYVAGSFYDGEKEILKKQISWCFLHKIGPKALPSGIVKNEREVISLISPHAGYIYSGPVAAHGYYYISREPVPEVVVIIGPNHTGIGAGVAVWCEGDWETPLGKVKVDSELANMLVKEGVAEEDESAHIYEHSIEVQIPFLQFIYQSEFKILPICMLLQDYETSYELGKTLAKLLSNKSALMIASTDFSHYVPYNEAYRRDSLAIDCIVKMDAKSLERIIMKENISMCGPGPVMTVLEASKILGAKECKRLCYATSGDTSGPKNEVVGYGSFVITK
ncbi:MAG: AmmeMemoRadiSam system protein B [Candidatus Verstraetearchaeota archaeon]|nr:AmmeMemoRadiSam system protein B [Candidatus Verstraetearchaeota archaeon]